MMKLASILLSICAVALPASAQTNPFLGRWDVTVTTPKTTYPDWIEVTEQNGKPQARVQVRAGSVRPAAEVKVDGSHLTLLLTRASAGRPETTWDLKVQGDRITGTQRQGDAVVQLVGVRAPELKRAMPKSWTTPEALFNGKDLTGWEPTDPAQNHWVAKDGVLLNEAHGANLKSTRKFDDFKLHIEFNCPENGNSGIYLRGRYEVQVEYEPAGSEDKYHSMGAIYGYLGSSKEFPRKPGEWESFDITLVGRTVTIVRNGITTIDHEEIPGITGGALDANEGEPGPFYIQGDHTGGMKYRNITISVPKK